MSEQSAVTEFRRSFRVSKFTVECIVTLIAGKPVSSRFEWEPYYPEVLVGQAFRQYRQRRNACFAALAEQLGGHVLTIDVAGAVVIGPDGTEQEITGEES